MSLRYEAVLAALAVAIALACGPRRLVSEARSAAGLLRGAPGPIVLVGSALGLAALLAVAHAKVDPLRYLLSTAASTVAFGAFTALALRFDGSREGTLRALDRVPIAAVAAAVALAATLAHFQVLEGIPHLSDEVAYQFQARALARGHLGFEPPPDLAFFEFIHVTDHGGVWHGIMNPGWPGVLAVGEALGAPWLVNPLLAAATLLLLHDFLRRVGPGAGSARWTVLVLAVSPFFAFMAATWMAHTASLFAFAAFLWAFSRLWHAPSPAMACVAGLALALGLLVRPLDAVVAAAPFGVALAWQALRAPRRALALGLLGAVASVGALATFAYNRALTGDPLVFPQALYFEQRFPGQGFGLGFGPQMGSEVHGPEWPGYWPSDAPRVTGHRLLTLLRDLHALPLLLASACLLALLRPAPGVGARLLGLSALALLAVYLAHFYHGIAYGSRHYYLTLPALGLAMAWPVHAARARGGPAGRLAGAASVALLLHVALFAVPPLVREYGDAYRAASGSLRDAVREAGLDRALVFVAGDRWGWKSAFPLNELPIGSGAVVFAQDLGPRNETLRARFPRRTAWRARIRPDDTVELVPLGPDDGAEPARHGPGDRREGTPRAPGAAREAGRPAE